jgi:hypothetical protein
MGFLDRFKGTPLELELEPAEVVAGGTVRARVKIGEPDRKARGGRVVLVWKNTFRYVDYDRDSDGDVDREVRRRTVENTVGSEPLFADGAVEAGEREVEFRIPPSAPGSAPDMVEWEVQAVVDRERAMDATEKAPVKVQTRLGELARWAETPPATSGECPMELQVAKRTFMPGETISGVLVIRPSADVEGRAVRVQLERRRFDQDQLEHGEEAARVVLDENVQLAMGAAREYPFELAVPPDAPPSLQTDKSSLHWYLEGVVDRKMRDDHSVKAELVVFNAPDS